MALIKLKTNKDVLKMMLDLSSDYYEANNIINKFTNAKYLRQKLKLIQELYPEIRIIDPHTHDKSSMKTDYQVMIHTIINAKWR